MIPAPLEPVSALALGVALALLARTSLSGRATHAWGAGIGVALGAAASLALDADRLAAAALTAFSILLGTRSRREAAVGASALALLAVALDAPIGLSAVGLSAWRAASGWQVLGEAAVALLLVQLLMPLGLLQACIVLGGTLSLSGLLTRLHGPAVQPPSARLVPPLLRTGFALGVLALLVADDRRRSLAGGDIWTAIGLAVPAALAGAVAFVALFGAATLLAVRDPARMVLFVTTAGSALVATASMRSAAALLLIPTTLALAAGAARCWMRLRARPS